MRVRARVDVTGVPPDSVVPTLMVREGLSVIFSVDVEFLCQDADLDLKALLFSEAVVTLINLDDLSGGALRYFHGVVERAEYVRKQALEHVYRLELRPRIHGLAYRTRTRIFQDQTVVEIVKRVFADAGIPAGSVNWQTNVTYPKREYCCQWKESELNFVLRLLEEEGIFYWFDHQSSDHLLNLADGPTVHQPIDGDNLLPFSRQQRGDDDIVQDLVFRTELCHDGYQARDWNFELGGDPLKSEALSPKAELVRYEYPGGFNKMSEGSRHVAQRLAESLVRRYTLTGRSNCTKLLPGRTFETVNAQPLNLCQEYLLLEVEHRYHQPVDDSPTYTSTFRATASAGVEFRPLRVTPRPRVFGKESAVVTGPPGEEIHVDKYGRIKVHFAWDREGTIDDKASCWMRVQQQNTSGGQIMPRVGWEVDVGFIDGDPDRPLVLQKMYNQETLPPYPLPANKTQSSLQSSTSPGGAGTNEIRLQDGNGGMEAFIHASKDFHLQAGNNLSEDIAVDAKVEVGLALSSGVTASENVSVGADQGISVTGDSGEEVAGAKTVSVGANDDWGTTGNHQITSAASRTETIGGLMNVLANKVTESFGASCDRSVGAAQSINSATSIDEVVGGSKTELVGGAKMVLIAGDMAENHKGNKALTSGMVTIKTGADVTVEANGAIALTSAGGITEKCGGDFKLSAKRVVVMAPGGLTMKAGGSTFSLKGSTIKVDASGLGGKGGPTLKLKGTIKYE
jgi:type VI secretion system secreted protein VgrG